MMSGDELITIENELKMLRWRKDAEVMALEARYGAQFEQLYARRDALLAEQLAALTGLPFKGKVAVTEALVNFLVDRNPLYESTFRAYWKVGDYTFVDSIYSDGRKVSLETSSRGSYIGGVPLELLQPYEEK